MAQYKHFLYKRSIIMYGSTHTRILSHNLAPVSYIYKLNEEHGPVLWWRGER